MQKHFLSRREAEELLKKIKEKYGLELKPEKIEIGKEKKEVYYFLDGVLAFYTQELIPTLCLFYKLKVPVSNFPRVKVDEGAVKAILRGADLFAPGIKEFLCNCKEGDIVIVTTLDDKPVAITKALISREEAEKTGKGKFSQNLHYLGDRIWQMCK